MIIFDFGPQPSTPTGPAGGILSGTYPNPGVAAVFLATLVQIAGTQTIGGQKNFIASETNFFGDVKLLKAWFVEAAASLDIDLKNTDGLRIYGQDTTEIASFNDGNLATLTPNIIFYKPVTLTGNLTIGSQLFMTGGGLSTGSANFILYSALRNGLTFQGADGGQIMTLNSNPAGADNPNSITMQQTIYFGQVPPLHPSDDYDVLVMSNDAFLHNPMTRVPKTDYLSLGRLNVGGTGAPISKATVSANATALTDPGFTGIVANIAGADGTNCRYMIQSFGGNPLLTFVTASGTAAAPTAVLLDQMLALITYQGYGATGYIASTKQMFITRAAENWTDIAQGAYQSFYSTSTGATASVERMRIYASGFIAIQSGGTFTDDLVNRVQISGSVKLQHLVGGTSAPTLTAGAGAGTAPTISITGTDLSMVVTITTGTVPTGANAIVFTVTFRIAYAAAPRVVINPGNRNAQGLAMPVLVPCAGETNGVTTLLFNCESPTVALVAATQYKWTIQVLQ